MWIEEILKMTEEDIEKLVAKELGEDEYDPNDSFEAGMCAGIQYIIDKLKEPLK